MVFLVISDVFEDLLEGGSITGLGEDECEDVVADVIIEESPPVDLVLVKAVQELVALHVGGREVASQHLREVHHRVVEAQSLRLSHGLVVLQVSVVVHCVHHCLDALRDMIKVAFWF